MKIKMWILVIIILLVIMEGILFFYINPTFGGKISKEEKKRYVIRAENYIDGKFKYPSTYEIEGEAIDNRVSSKGTYPKSELPSVKPSIDDKALIDELTVTWFGHSMSLVQMHGLNIMFDPIFSKRPSPFSFVGPKRFSEPPIEIEELPEIDILIISHDHYDHLDIHSIKKMDSKVGKYIVPLGVEKHLKRWQIDESKIESLAWWEEVQINGVTIACTPARHFSNRQVFDMTSTLYASWVLKDENYQIYESGDGGFGGHFNEIHKRYGDFDFVMMESGQYNMRWHYVHMFPEEAVKAAKILGAKISMPIHWGTFVLSNHAWDDSIERFVRTAEKKGVEVVTPKLGETVYLNRHTDYQEKWWKDIW